MAVVFVLFYTQTDARFSFTKIFSKNQSHTSQLQTTEEFDTINLKNSQLSAEVVNKKTQLEFYSSESKEFAKNIEELQL